MDKTKSLSQKYPDLEWWSVGNVSEPGVKEKIKTVVYEKNPPVIFNNKSTVKRLDVRISSVHNEDQQLLHHLLQETRER